MQVFFRFCYKKKMNCPEERKRRRRRKKPFPYRHALTTPSLLADSSSLTPPWPTIEARAVIESLCARLAAADSTLKGSREDDEEQ